MLSLILLGVAQQYQNPTANQEVVIQFLDAEFSETKPEDSLHQISNALELIGAEAIEISETKNGFFRIAYHSDKAIESIKQMLSNQIDLAFDASSNKNSESNNQEYNFDIFKIESGYSSHWDLEGHQVETLNLKSDRSFNPDVFKFSDVVKSENDNLVLNSTLKANATNVFVLDTLSHNIPETRAGPIA